MAESIEFSTYEKGKEIEDRSPEDPFPHSGAIPRTNSCVETRKNVLAACLALITLATLLMGTATQYWHLVVLRMMIGAGESSFAPSASSIISDLFTESVRGLALGIFNWGIYLGYGLSYIIGNYVTAADILGMGWRWSYYISGMLGVLVLVYMLVVLEEPPRLGGPDDDKPSPHPAPLTDTTSIDSDTSYAMSDMQLPPRSPSVKDQAAQTKRRSTYYPHFNVGAWVSWVSIVGGTVGVAVGGFVSDRLVKKLGVKARLYVLAASQFAATPFAAGVLYLAPPAAMYSLLCAYFFAEMWFGILFAVLLDIVPGTVKASSLAFFLFVMNNIGGNAPVLVEPLRNAFSYRTALYIMYPGCFLLSELTAHVHFKIITYSLLLITYLDSQL
ncbi:hypothetical protein HAZT_HAZT011263, partial [Hyalella azteca]